jgi:hypothetical protein
MRKLLVCGKSGLRKEELILPVSVIISKEEYQMETYNRICIEDYTVKAENGDILELSRGEEYLTSTERDGKVTVFSSYWVKVPAEIFAGAKLFTY